MNTPYDAIDRGEMRLRLQPVVEVATREVAGVDAMVRWLRPGVPELAYVTGPAGESAELGAWLTGEACQAAAALAPHGGGRLTVSVGLAARHLGAGSAEALGAALRDSGCEPWRLVVDVRGTAFVEDLAAAFETLGTIRGLGIGLGLADYGTGRSSLRYLKDVPLDRITLAPSFVRAIGADPRATAVVASTIGLAHALGVRVLADGVTTAAQLALLRGVGCDLARGDHVSPPLTLGALQRWLRDRSRASRCHVQAPAKAMPEAGHILRLYGEGASLLTIAGALNTDGRRTALGVRWSPRSVGDVVARARAEAAGAAL